MAWGCGWCWGGTGNRDGGVAGIGVWVGLGRWLWVEGNCIQGNRQGEGGGRGDVVVFEGGNQDVSVVQAEPGPGNSVLPQWNQSLHGRRTASSSCEPGVLSSSSWQLRCCSVCWTGVWPTCTAPTPATWASGPTARSTRVPTCAKSRVSGGRGGLWGALWGGGL